MSEFSLIKLQAPRTVILLKRLQHRFFPVKSDKFLRTPSFIEHLQWLLLTDLGFQPATLLQKRLRQRFFSVNFTKHFFSQNSSGWLLLVFICEFWEVFQNTYLKSTPEKLLISCISYRILTTRYSKK